MAVDEPEVWRKNIRLVLRPSCPLCGATCYRNIVTGKVWCSFALCSYGIVTPVTFFVPMEQGEE